VALSQTVALSQPVAAAPFFVATRVWAQLGLRAPRGGAWQGSQGR
jgi:hypothetical protein